MSERMHFILKEYCDKKKLFLSTPYDNDSVDLLTKLKSTHLKLHLQIIRTILY